MAQVFMREHYAETLAAIRRGRCPVCEVPLTHVPLVDEDTPPVFRCERHGCWATNGAQSAWYADGEPRQGSSVPRLGWDQQTPGWWRPPSSGGAGS